MKKQRFDYSGFSLRRLNEPRFAHIKLLAGWIVYFAMYFLTENLWVDTMYQRSIVYFIFSPHPSVFYLCLLSIGLRYWPV